MCLKAILELKKSEGKRPGFHYLRVLIRRKMSEQKTVFDLYRKCLGS
jgi:hypothetical protein